MENEDPAITFDRVAGEHAMYRQLLSLLLGSSPAAMEALRSVTPATARELMEARPVSDVFIAQAIDALTDITRRAEHVAAAREGRG
jgi:hypothetical protein